MAGETITVTIFPDKEALTAEVWQIPVEELLEHIEVESAPRKEKLRWLKFATFGDVRSEHNSLRNNKNVVSITGVEGDYDQEKMSIGEAATRLHNAGVWSILYTSPSHTPEKPRWRVICPLSQPRHPDDRKQLVARINGVLGGVLSGESFTLSQSYYFGYVTNGVGAHQVLQVSGTAIDLLPALDKGAIGKRETKPPPSGNGRSTLEQNAAAEAAGAHGYSETDALLRAIIDGSALRPSVTALAGRYAAAGWPIEAAWETIRGAMRANTTRSDYEVREPQELAAVRWVYEREAQKPGGGAGERSEPGDGAADDDAARDPGTKENRQSSGGAREYPWIWKQMQEWDQTPPPQQEWAVLDRIPAHQVFLLSGHGATGKSTVGLNLCVAHVLGRDWLATLPELGSAFFIDAEDELNVLHRRLDANVRHYQVTYGQLVDDGLHLLPMAGEDAVLAIADRNGKIMPTPFYHHLLERASDIKPKQVVIASAANVFAGNENDRTQVQQFIALLTRIAIRTGGAVTLIAHPSIAGLETKTGLSGSTQWHNSVRARAWLKGYAVKDDEQPDDDLRVLQWIKNQYGAVAAEQTLRWRDGMFLLEAQRGVDQLARQALVDRVFEQILRRFESINRRVSPYRSPTFAPPIFANEEEAKTIKASRAELESAMGRLLKARVIKIKTWGPQSKERHCLVIERPVSTEE